MFTFIICRNFFLACRYSLPLHVNSASGRINDGPWGPQKDDVLGWASVPVGEELLFGLRSVGFNMMEHNLAVNIRSNICAVRKSVKLCWENTANTRRLCLAEDLKQFCLYFLPVLGGFLLTCNNPKLTVFPPSFSPQWQQCSLQLFFGYYYRSINRNWQSSSFTAALSGFQLLGHTLALSQWNLPPWFLVVTLSGGPNATTGVSPRGVSSPSLIWPHVTWAQEMSPGLQLKPRCDSRHSVFLYQIHPHKLFLTLWPQSWFFFLFYPGWYMVSFTNIGESWQNHRSSVKRSSEHQISNIAIDSQLNLDLLFD